MDEADRWEAMQEKLRQMNALCGLLQRKNAKLKEEITILRARKNYWKKLCAELEKK